MPSRNVVSWNAMILGNVKCGQGQKALELFQQMQPEGVPPDPVTFVGILNACASLQALEEGRHTHEQIIQNGCESNVFVGSSLVDMYAKCGSMEEAWRVFNKLPSCDVVSWTAISLIDMYAKCGSMEDAWRVFNRMPSRDVVTWTAMLNGFSMHGHGGEAIAHFEQMCEESIEINNITFVCLLSACSHAGLVYEGLCYFDSMNLVYRICPTVEHYTCMVDILGRAGYLHEAEDMIKTMTGEPSIAVWMALLGACRIHGDTEVGECIAKRVLEIDPGNFAGYVLLSNIYAA
ncbi:unnamed protein product, partial [Sphagnum balticum]